MTTGNTGNIHYEITRFSQYVNLTIASGAAISEQFDFRSFTMGVIEMTAAAWTTANIGFQVSSNLSGTYRELYDHNGQLVQIASPVAGRAYELPPEVAGARYIKLWSQTVGTGTNQGAARTLTIEVKG